MTAVEIVMKRIDAPEDEVSYYVDLAVLRVCTYLKQDEIKVSDYLFSIADIATLMYQMDNSVKQTKSGLGYESKSMSEGGVSKSETSMTGSDIRSTYESAIQDILNGLDGSAGMVRFL